jgi:hypothetical protein
MSDQTPTEPVEQTPSPNPETQETTPEPASLLSEAEAAFDPEGLKFADGFEKNELYDEFVNFAKDSELSLPKAQKLVDLWSKGAELTAKSTAAAWEAQNQKWQEEVKADPEVGGAKLPGVLQTISKLFDDPELDGPQLRRDLAFTGAGNLKSVVKAFYVLGKRLSEGSAVAGSPPGMNGQRPSIADALYPGGPRSGNPRMEQ